MLKLKTYKLKKKRYTASTLTFLMFFITIFLAFAALAVDGTITLTNRAKLQNITEQTALTAASEFSASSSNVETTAQTTFNFLKQDGLKFATAITTSDASAKKITVNATYISQPYFLAFLGVNGIRLEAKATAMSESLPITANYSGINWLTTKAAYLSDILSKDLNLNDTAILAPLGGFSSFSYDKTTGFAIFSRISGGDSAPLSLGPGGFITMKMPVPIVDKPGNDLYIKEAGTALEGYLVFAGIDNDPNNPYVNYSNPGAGIAWVNISGSGTPEDSGMSSYALQTANTQLPTNIQDKFYGSGYFDIAKKNLSMVKYIRIVDDNQESAFYKNASNGLYYKAMIYGEASTSTPGADIGSVQVLNHVKLIAS